MSQSKHLVFHRHIASRTALFSYSCAVTAWPIYPFQTISIDLQCVAICWLADRVAPHKRHCDCRLACELCVHHIISLRHSCIGAACQRSLFSPLAHFADIPRFARPLPVCVSMRQLSGSRKYDFFVPLLHTVEVPAHQINATNTRVLE